MSRGHIFTRAAGLPCDFVEPPFAPLDLAAKASFFLPTIVPFCQGGPLVSHIDVDKMYGCGQA
jgi:hypothetical protein